MDDGPVLWCKDLRKRFKERLAVDGVGSEVAPGETYGLLGPNGAGKTTTISMICGLLRRDGGEVTVARASLDRDPGQGKAAAYSGGMQRRPNIAAGLLHRPRLPPAWTGSTRPGSWPAGSTWWPATVAGCCRGCWRRPSTPGPR
jgi:ABC-type multidrug transport system ATPase subunit